MVPFVTNRGGPLVGIEALSLQGIPVDDLLLTRENENQMSDLAGNAMTATHRRGVHARGDDAHDGHSGWEETQDCETRVEA